MKNRPISVTIAPRTILLAFFLIVACLLVLRLLDIVLLVAFSLLFAAALHPSVRWIMHRFRVSKGVAIGILYIIIFAIVTAIVALVVPPVTSQINSLIHNSPQYQHTLIDYFNKTPAAQNAVSNLFNKLNQNSGVIVTSLATATLGILTTVFGIITVVILTAYFMSGGRHMVNTMLGYLPEKQWRARGLTLASRISNKLGFWLRGQLVLSLIRFVTHYIGLSLLGVPYALILSLLAGLLESIPTFGAWFSGIVTVLVALTVSPGKAIATAILVFLVQLVEANIITPQVMKRALGIPAGMVIISLLVFGKLFGLIGVLLAAPMAAIVAILAAEFAPDGKRMWLTSRGYK